MNGYSFSKNGKHFCTCWGAKYAAEQIAETASLQSMHTQSVNEWYVGKENGIETASGADILAYANGPTEKTYSVKAEYADRWTEDATYPLIVTESEISRLAAEWGVSFCDLLDQVDEISND